MNLGVGSFLVAVPLPPNLARALRHCLWRPAFTWNACRRNSDRMAGQKIENLTLSHYTKSKSKSVVYKIPCSGVCNKSYIGETRRGLITRISEHKRDVRNRNRSNAIVLHIEECKKLPDGGKACVIEEGMSKSEKIWRRLIFFWTIP